MNLLQSLKDKNKHIEIKECIDADFLRFGQVITDFDTSLIIDDIESLVQSPISGNTYNPHFDDLTKFDILNEIGNRVYGGMSFQIGFVAGHNNEFNGMEYHQCSETLLPISDCLLFLGSRVDLVDNEYDMKKAEAFYLRKGQLIELYSTTLHYTPCRVSSDAFKVLIYLLDSTNSPLNGKYGILAKKNKWVITHPSKVNKISEGVYPGLMGDLVEVQL
jgi:hypothetical protein